MNCLVAGSTGLVGSLLIDELLGSGSKVEALSRKVLTSNNQLLNYHRINFEDLNTYKDLFIDITDVFICLGTTIKKAGSQKAFYNVDVNYCHVIAKAASEAGVPNLSIVTSIGADSNSKNFYLKCKGEIEDKISELKFDSISIFRPGLLIGERQERRVAEAFGQIIQPRFIDPLLRGSSSKYRSVRGLDLAKSLKQFSGKKPGKNIYQYQDFLVG